MSTGQILLLGAIAGATIFLGLPIGRMRGLGPASRAGLSALATGILVFLLWDVLTGAVEPIESALTAHDWGRFAWLAALGLGGFALGLMSLVYYADWMKKRGSRRASSLVGPGAAALDEFEHRGWIDRLTPGEQLALLIAIGIGVHNFGEGLAIGQAATAGEISLAVTLIIGFGLHNATEGFGICGPMSGEGTQPTWKYLVLLGVIGGVADVPRHRTRPGVVERGRVGRVLRRRGRLDPLRRAGAVRGQPDVRTHEARHLARPRRHHARLRHGLHRHRRRRLTGAPSGAPAHAPTHRAGSRPSALGSDDIA